MNLKTVTFLILLLPTFCYSYLYSIIYNKLINCIPVEVYTDTSFLQCIDKCYQSLLPVINTNTSESDDDKGDCHCYEKSCGYIVQGNTTWKEVQLKDPPAAGNSWQPNDQRIVMLADVQQDYCVQPENGNCDPAEGEKIVFKPRDGGHCKEAALFLFDRERGTLTHQCSGKKVCVQDSTEAVLLNSNCLQSFAETVIYRTMFDTLQFGNAFCLYPSNGEPKNSHVKRRKKCMQPEAKVKLVGFDVGAPVKMEFYKLGEVNNFNELEAQVSYPSLPTLTGWLDNMASPIDIDDDFVGRLTAYFVPPMTGSYKFTINADDSGELFIGNIPGSAGQSDLKKLKYFHDNNRPKRFEVLESQYWVEKQISDAVYLVGGEKYFLKGRYIESTGKDFLKIGVILPNGEKVIPITSRYLSKDGCN